MTDCSAGHGGGTPRAPVSEAELAGLLSRNGVHPPAHEIRALLPSAARFQAMLDNVNRPLERTAELAAVFVVLDR